MRFKVLKGGFGDWVEDRNRYPVSIHCWANDSLLAEGAAFSKTAIELRAKIEIFETRFSLLQKPQVFRSGPLGLENEDSYLPSIPFFFLGQSFFSTQEGRTKDCFPPYNLKEVCISKNLEDKRIYFILNSSCGI